MKKAILFLVVFSYFSASSMGQKRFFIELSGNYLLPYEISTSPEFQLQPVYYPAYGISYISYSLKESYETRPGINLHIGQETPLFNNFSIETSLGISWLKFKRSVFIESLENNTVQNPLPVSPGLPIGSLYPRLLPDPETNPVNPFEPSDKLGLTDILYFTVPLKVNYQIINEKLYFGAGITTSLVAWSRQVKTQMVYPPLSSSSSLIFQQEYNNYTSDGINNLYFTGNISLSYNLHSNIGVTTTYHHGLSPTYDKSMRTAGDWKSSHISLGIRYNLN